MFRIRLPIPHINVVKRGALVPRVPKVRKPRRTGSKPRRTR